MESVRCWRRLIKTRLALMGFSFFRRHESRENETFTSRLRPSKAPQKAALQGHVLRSPRTHEPANSHSTRFHNNWAIKGTIEKPQRGKKCVHHVDKLDYKRAGVRREKMNFLVNYTRNENNANRAALICPFTEIGKASFFRVLSVPTSMNHSMMLQNEMT